MTLEPGRSILHYRLAEKIGQGGMGEVWRATDTRLDREVALKFLPDAVTHDATRLERFAREAKTLASLDDPGIASIHGIEEHERHRFLVMELVLGKDLAEVLERGPLPLAECLEIGLRIAQAVEIAHTQGIIHRDLKPANVKRTPDGRIKVLDFGLAKVLGPEVSSGGADVGMSPTITSAGTAAGVILGTAAYMSPEQARGRAVDKRTDVWSFGVLLYELLTGDNPFRGETVADSVGAILHRDPDLGRLPPATPPGVRRLLRRCLARKRSQRLHDIGDARIELEEAIANPESEAIGSTGVSAGSSRSRAPWIALALLLPVVGTGAWWLGSRPEPAATEPVRQFELMPDAEPDNVVLSPDGSRLAFVLDRKILIRSLDSLEARVLAEDTDREIVSLFWSPDGRSLGVSRAGSSLERIDLDGGGPVTLTSTEVLIGEPEWGDDGHVYFSRFQSGIQRIPENGGAPEDVIPLREDTIDYHGFDVLPGGRGVLIVPHHEANDARSIVLERPDRAPEVLFESDSPIANPSFAASGHVLFFRDENPRGLWALPFSIESMSAQGDPFLVVPDLYEASVSERGDMVYTKAALHRGKQKQEVVWLDRDGTTVDRLDMALYEADAPVLSPDATRIALIARGIGRPSTAKRNLWVIDLERGSATKLTEFGVVPSLPAWSEDGTRIAVLREFSTSSGDNELVAVRADGSGEPETILEADITFRCALTRDWSRAAFMSGSATSATGMAIAERRLDDPDSLSVIVDGPGQDVLPALHPDGDWIAYASGPAFVSLDTFVQRFPEGGGRFKVSVGGGGSPFWSLDGTRLYYVSMPPNGPDSEVVEVTFDDSGPSLSLGRPTTLFRVDGGSPWMTIDADGRFLHLADVEPAEGEEAPDTAGIVFVQNWLSRFQEPGSGPARR